MVQIANIITVLAAGASVANASNTRRAARASEVKSAVNGYVNLLQSMSDNIASGQSLSNSDMKGALETYMGLMGTMKDMLQAPPNATAPFKPNWEGAMIGAGVASTFGALAGALLGVYTDWTFKGFNDGLTAALGFDPSTLLPPGGFGPAGLPLPNTGAPAPPPPKTAPAPAVPVATPAPKSPVAPKSPAAPISSIAPVVPAAGSMPGMSGHSHGGT